VTQAIMFSSISKTKNWSIFSDGLLRAVQELFALHGGAGRVVDEAHVALGRFADLLIVVAVDEGAHALVGDLVEQAVEDAAVDDMHAWRAGLDGFDGVRRLAADRLGDMVGFGVENLGQSLDGDFAPDLTVDLKTGMRGEVDDLRGVQGLGDFGRRGGRN